MKPEILTSFTAVTFVFTAFALASANSYLSQSADAPWIDAGAFTGFDEKRQVSGEQILQKEPSRHDRPFLRNEYTKLEMVSPTDLMVDGVAAGDLLNIRVRPSPGADVVARLNNGAVVKKLGCRESAGHQWCLVELVKGERQTGWAAGRYLKKPSEHPAANQLCFR